MVTSAKRVLSTCLVLFVLFAGIARAPGVMLTSDQGVMVFEICTGAGTKVISVAIEAEDDPDGPQHHDPGCDFFSAQVAAFLKGVEYTRLDVKGANLAYQLPYRDFAVERVAQNANLTRAPPFLS